MPDTTYSTSGAARAAGVSPGTVRNLTPGGRFGEAYAGLWSAGADVPDGQPRRLTARDVAQLAYIRSRTAAGISHAEVAAELRAGALESFEFTPLEGLPRKREEPASLATITPEQAGVVVLQGIAAELAHSITGQLSEAQARADRLSEDLRAAESRAAAAEARAQELAAQLEQARRPWWARLFGR